MMGKKGKSLGERSTVLWEMLLHAGEDVRDVVLMSRPKEMRCQNHSNVYGNPGTMFSWFVGVEEFFFFLRKIKKIAVCFSLLTLPC
jgi:hypothetical protein